MEFTLGSETTQDWGHKAYRATACCWLLDKSIQVKWVSCLGREVEGGVWAERWTVCFLLPLLMLEI